MTVLLIGRKKGEGFYVGRGVRLTLLEIEGRTMRALVEVPENIAVSDERLPMVEHMAKQLTAETSKRPEERAKVLWAFGPLGEGDGIRIGRGVCVHVLQVQTDGNVRFGIDAPRHVSVSRDDFTYAQHLKFQTERESAAGSAPDTEVM